MTMIETVRAFRPARLLVAGLFMAALIPLGANAASLKEIQKRGYMNIATEDNYAPFEFVEGGTPKGFTHDVVAELRKYAKFEVRQDIHPWSGLLASVRAGKDDAALHGSTVPGDLLRVVDFPWPTPGDRQSV